MLKNIGRYLKNISTHLKNLKKHFKKSKKYQYDTDYWFNERNEEDYTINNSINTFQGTRKLFNERRSSFYVKKQRELEKNFIKKKQSIIF